LEIKKACEEIYTPDPSRFMRLNDSILDKVEDIYLKMVTDNDPLE
jgi:hypothetical protein